MAVVLGSVRWPWTGHGRSDGAASFAALNAKVATIDAAMAPYGMVCTTGPAVFYFACTDQRPG